MVEFVKLTAPGGPRPWFVMHPLAWITVTFVCSIFYLNFVLLAFALGMMRSEDFRMHGLCMVCMLIALSVWPNTHWPALHKSFWMCEFRPRMSATLFDALTTCFLLSQHLPTCFLPPHTAGPISLTSVSRCLDSTRRSDTFSSSRLTPSCHSGPGRTRPSCPDLWPPSRGRRCIGSASPADDAPNLPLDQVRPGEQTGPQAGAHEGVTAART